MNLRRVQSALLTSVLMLVACQGAGYAQAGATTSDHSDKPFAPFEQWKDLVLKHDTYGLKAVYSANPVAQIKVGSDDLDASGDIRFWTGLKASSMKVDIFQSGASQVQPGAYQVLFRAEIRSAADTTEQTLYLTEGQLWQQQDQQWRLVVVKRTPASRLEQPASTKKDIYPMKADAQAEIKDALSKSSKEHKRVLVVFGANWCYDCHVLDLAFRREDIAPILEANFEIVHVDVGQGEKNQDLMKEYEVPMERGIPAIAVLDGDGKLLYSQKNGEFEKARSLGPEDLLKFLNQWKPGANKG